MSDTRLEVIERQGGWWVVRTRDDGYLLPLKGPATTRIYAAYDQSRLRRAVDRRAVRP
jgi:hypothetical protein